MSASSSPPLAPDTTVLCIDVGQPRVSKQLQIPPEHNGKKVHSVPRDTKSPAKDRICDLRLGKSRVIAGWTSSMQTLADCRSRRPESTIYDNGKIDAVIVTSVWDNPETDDLFKPGDIIVKFYGSNAGGQAWRAVKALNDETGGKGLFLPSCKDVDMSLLEARDPFHDWRLSGLSMIHTNQEKLGKEVEFYPELTALQSYHGTTPVVAILGVTEPDQAKSSGDSAARRVLNEDITSCALDLVSLMSDMSGKAANLRTGGVVKAPDLPAIPDVFPRLEWPSHGDNVLLVIPTENKQKVALIEQCVGFSTDPERKVFVKMVKADSGVGEQPYNEAGLDGACNRIKNAMEDLFRKVEDEDPEWLDLFKANHIGVVAFACIESYIQTATHLDARDEERRAVDYGLIVLHNATMHTAIRDNPATGSPSTLARVSEGVAIDYSWVQKAQRLGYSHGDQNHGNVTVGTIIAARIPGIDKANWHAEFAGVSRYDLISRAMEDMAPLW